VAILAVPAAAADCPPAAVVAERLQALDLESSSRTARFEWDPPMSLFTKAAERPGRPMVETIGLIGCGAMLVDLPVEPLWMALNDEEHFSTEGYLPLVQSKVIKGRAHQGERLIYQSFKSFGFGRWWVNRVWQNAELYRSSDRQMWELVWEDVMDEVKPEEPPLASLIPKVDPIKSSRGAWLLIPMGESCTLMEYYTDSNPGGLISAAQRLLGGRTMRSTFEGMVEIAREDISKPHDGAPFTRPDGTPITPGE